MLKGSLFSIIGLSNFYSKHYFDGAFEFVEGVITVFLLFMWPHWLCKLQQRIKTFISVGMLIILIAGHIVELIYMFCSRTFKPHIVILIISSLGAGLIQYKYGLQFKTFIMMLSVLIIISNTASNLFLFEFNFKLDGCGYPFTLDHQAVNNSNMLTIRMYSPHT